MGWEWGVHKRPRAKRIYSLIYFATTGQRCVGGGGRAGGAGIGCVLSPFSYAYMKTYDQQPPPTITEPQESSPPRSRP